MVDSDDLAGLVEAAPDGLFMVSDAGKILHANRQALTLFGYAAQDLVGQEVDILLPLDRRAGHRGHRTRYHDTPRTRPMGSGLQLFARRKDGTVVPVEVSLSPTTHDGEPAVIAAVRDITARVRFEAHTRRIERLIDRAHEGVYLIDPTELRFTYVNVGAARQSGYHRDELLSMSPLRLMPDMHEALLRRMVDRAIRPGGISPVITVLRRADGNDVPVELLLELDAAADGSPPAIAALVRDLSERRESEEQLDEARRELHLVEDRERIARDLHDRVIQRLFATGMGLQAVVDTVGGVAPRSRIERAVDDLDATIREIRTVIFELEPHDGHDWSLRRKVVETGRAARRALGFEPSIAFDGPIDTLVSLEAASALLATLQEGLSNVARHARATSVAVLVAASSANGVQLTVTDDGVGIPASVDVGNGLVNMAARATRLGGRFEVGATSGRPGTTLSWEVPVAAVVSQQ